jgi:hypothetical protein
MVGTLVRKYCIKEVAFPLPKRLSLKLPTNRRFVVDVELLLVISEST